MPQPAFWGPIIRAVAGGENVSRRTMGFKKVNKGQVFPQDSTIFFSFFLWASRCQVLEGMSNKFRANIRRSDCVGPKYQVIFNAQNYPILKLSNTRHLRKLHLFFAQNSKSPHRFWDIRHWNCAHVMHEPLSTPEWRLFLVFRRKVGIPYERLKLYKN